MKNKFIISVFVILIIILITNFVQAVNFEITLPNDFKKENVQNQYNIALYATNERKDESLVIVQQQNELTKKVGNLKLINDEEYETFLNKYNEAKLQEGQTVLKQEKYIKDDMVFIDTIFEYIYNDQKIQTEEYYTIINETTITISVSFLNKQVDSIKVKEIVNSINIDNDNSIDLTFLALPVVLIILFAIYFIKERKNKIQLNEIERTKLLQKVKEDMSKINYSKFGGILIFFAITIVFNVVNLSFGIIEIIPQINWNAYKVIDKIYAISAILQNIISLIGIIFITYCLTKKEDKTIKKIINTFIIMLISLILLTIIRIIMQIVLEGINENFIKYIATETQVFTRSTVYILIWYFYFKNSIRVSVYYKEKTLEQIIINPKKWYQINEINKRVMEFKIIEYFEKNKAYEYASGIYINKLPKEYANSIALSDLNTKKIIRLKRAKYYLSKQDLNSPKSQKRKTFKNVMTAIIIYLFVLLILYFI